ncbi:MAG: SUMF1/EgtB/PvdO family nonheme iron enzyme, partial [bacterium]|nr:SUMF1/EgtB/PvdO family nonheme iron enzyme [bacterium]
LMHHPPFNWLKDLEGKTGTELFKQCHLLLHGHIHSQRSMVVRNPDTVFLALGANASYTKDREGHIGFQCIEVPSSGGDGGEITVWPYILDTRQNEVVPDTRRWKNQEGKPFFTIGTAAGNDEKKEDETPEPEIPLIIPKEYKQWVREFHSKVSLDQLAKKGEAILVDLPEVYIPLVTSNPFHSLHETEDGKRSGKGRRAKKEIDTDQNSEPAVIDVEELVGRVDCLLLRGTAGMGKTTIIKHLAYLLTHGTAPPRLEGFLPVIVFLKDLWPLYMEKQKNNKKTITLDALLNDYFKKTACPLTGPIAAAFLAGNRALMLVDGLDEVPKDIRPHVIDMLHRFRFANKGNRFLFTGRPHGLQGKGERCFREFLHDLLPLDRERSSDFIVRWFRAVAGMGRDFADGNSTALINEIRCHERAEEVFTGNPLLLTALCVFYIVGGKRIPDQRADLYDRIVDNLMYRRFQTAADPGLEMRVLDFLMLLAHTMHCDNLIKMEACEAVDLLKTQIPVKKEEAVNKYKQRMESLFESIESQCGLLNRLPGGEVDFSHLSFQEFLAAKYMLDMDMDFQQYLDSPWWEEVLLLYAGLLNLKQRRKSNRMVAELLPASPRICLLGATALRDFPADRREETVTKKVREEMMSLMISKEPLETRFKAGEILGEIGDPRIDVLAPPMVTVEAGEFIMGSTKGESREKPQRKIYLDAFEIAKYPLTNGGYRCFIEDGGYITKAFWAPEGWQWVKREKRKCPRYWADGKWNGANFPVVGISWYEADAYVRWLSEKTSEFYRLPTEAQWEKAARGTDGRKFSWGESNDKNRCNYRESGLGRTSPVGMFPGGESPWGCMDMSGNGWEWCADWAISDYYKSAPDKNPLGPDNGELRVIRGGSWFDDGKYVRSAYRSWDGPSYSGYAGLRLARGDKK